jgi:hypothetical protein
MTKKKSCKVQLCSHICVKIDPNINDVSNLLNKVWETKLSPNWASFKYLEMFQRLDIQSAISFFLWKFKAQTNYSQKNDCESNWRVDLDH